MELWAWPRSIDLFHVCVPIFSMEDLFGDLPPPVQPAAGVGAQENPPTINEDVSVASLGKRKAAQSEEGKKRRRGLVVQLKGYVAERKGERVDMQDAHIILDDFSSYCSSLSEDIDQVSHYGVFDGHAGHRASQFAARHLHKHIGSRMPQSDVASIDKEVKRCLMEAFKKTDEEFLSAAAAATPSWKDGCTAAVLLVVNDVVFSANLGDSRAVLCRRESNKEMKCVQLTRDHTPAIFEERKRIEKAGGSVRDGRVMGVVEVSRSFGDGRFKHCGITAVPDIFRCQLTTNDSFMIVACDGLWKVFSALEAAKFITAILEDKSVKLSAASTTPDTNYQSTLPQTDREFRYTTACTQLAVEAVRRGCTDNVTVMLVDIDSEEATSADENDHKKTEHSTLENRCQDT